MRRPPVVLVFLLALSLAACGGGGGSSGGGGIPPTPTPTPTATPTSPPSSSCTQSNSGAPGGYGPFDVSQALDFPFTSGSTEYNGSGQTVAIVIDSNVNPSDVSAYLAHSGIAETGTITDKPVNGTDTGCHSGEQDEATLDVETVAGLAPAANIIIYQLPFHSGGVADQDIADAYNQIISDHKAFVVNTSLGGCEGSGTPPEDPVMKNGAAHGVLFVSSAGDSGNLCQTGPDQVGASYPASDPYGIGVGGTETNPPAYALTSHTEWNDSSCSGGICAGGGGPSTVFPISLFSYQTAALLNTCAGAPNGGSPCSTSFRNTPDVSMPAEDVNVYEGGWWQADGTSWSSPEYAAMMADVFQFCHLSTGFTQPQSIPYYVYGRTPSDFIDATVGSDRIGSHTPYYTAAVGYDDSNGLGVPKGSSLAQTACPGGSPASGLSVTSHQTMALPANPMPATIDVTPRVGGLVDRGERASNESTRIQLVLRPEFASAGSEAQIVSALQDAGLTVVRRFQNHLIIDAEGPNAAVERAFRTQMHDVSQGRFGVRYLPIRPVTLPASIAPYVATASLDNVVMRHVPNPRM